MSPDSGLTPSLDKLDYFVLIDEFVIENRFPFRFDFAVPEAPLFGIVDIFISILRVQRSR